MTRGIFVVAELTGRAREEVLAVQQWADPKLASGSVPHITLVGSSGVGPIVPDTPVERIRDLLEPVTEDTPPITVHFGPPMRFMQTNIVVLPIDPHGPLRTLHERIATSGLSFARPRFMYSPHCTLSFYQTLTPEARRRLLNVRVDEPVVVDRLQFYYSLDPQPARKILELELGVGQRAA
jgi:2'-5' RNA ligase